MIEPASEAARPARPVHFAMIERRDRHRTAEAWCCVSAITAAGVVRDGNMAGAILSALNELDARCAGRHIPEPEDAAKGGV